MDGKTQYRVKMSILSKLIDMSNEISIKSLNKNVLGIDNIF